MATERLKDILNELNIDFVKYRYIAGAASIITVLGAWLLFFVVGPNWGIDFTGGTEIQMKFEQQTDIADVRKALKQLGLSEDSVYAVGDPSLHEFKVRIQDPTFGAQEAVDDVKAKLVGKYGNDWIDQLSFDAQVGARISMTYKGPEVKPQDVQKLFVGDDGKPSGITVRAGQQDNSLVITLPGLGSEIQKKIQAVMPDHPFHVTQTDEVGPKVGAELRVQGFLAVGATIILILIYLAFRFDITFAPGAVIALVHDTSVVLGIFVLMHKELNLSILGALMTIIGYSLNDTVIIYDRLRENKEKYRRIDTKELINLSVNETLTRTVSTSGATMLAISPFLIMGGPVIGDFSLAMFLGIIVGTYSTIYVASPLILVMEEIQPWLNKLVAGRGGAAQIPAGGPADVMTAPQGALPDTGAAPADPARPMTESEKRRRERAERERAEKEKQGKR